MLNISKYHSAIVCCSVVATASLAGLVQSAHAAEQIIYPNVRAEQGSILIAQTNNSNTTGTNVSNITGTNVSNTTGTNVSNTTGTNVSNTTGTNVSNTTGTNVSNSTGTNVSNSPSGSFSSRGGSSGGGFSSAVRSQASTISARVDLAQGNYSRAAAALAQAETQTTVAQSGPVRYGRQSVGDLASCGCPNADTVGTTPTARPELLAARATEAEAATELAAAKAEAQKFIESVKNDIARNSNVDNSLW